MSICARYRGLSTSEQSLIVDKNKQVRRYFAVVPAEILTPMGETQSPLPYFVVRIPSLPLKDISLGCTVKPFMH